MMIALLPYYKPPQEMAKLQQSQREVDDLMKQLDQMKNQATDPQTAQQMQQAMAQLQQHVQEMEGQLNDAMQQNQQLQQQNDQLDKDNKQLKIRQPFTVTVSSSVLEENVDLYLQDDTSSKTPCPPFDPTQAHNSTFWPGDHHIYGAAFATWIVRDSPVGVHYKLYAKLSNDFGQRQPCTVSTLVVSDGPDVTVPTVKLTPERPWLLAGVLTVDKDNALSYQEATQAEARCRVAEAAEGDATQNHADGHADADSDPNGHANANRDAHGDLIAQDPGDPARQCDPQTPFSILNHHSHGP
ncbi:MAG: hypothetical protein QM796_06520 [Chthoniobacteraceae bacterium]